MFRLSIIIPAYNEEKRISSTLNSIINDLYELSDINYYEIIIIDDGSIDQTVKIVNNIIKNNKEIDIKLFKLSPNQGKGKAVAYGIQKARYEYVLFLDADNSTELKEIRKFFSYIKDNDIIIGSRYYKGNCNVIQPWYRSILGRCFNLIVRKIFKLNIYDTQCGFKMFNTSLAKEIFSKQISNGWFFDLEVLLIANKRGIHIKEVPIVWRHYAGGKFKLLNILQAIRYILYFWYRYRL